MSSNSSDSSQSDNWSYFSPYSIDSVQQFELNWSEWELSLHEYISHPRLYIEVKKIIKFWFKSGGGPKMMNYFLNRYFHKGKRGLFVYHNINYKSIKFRPNGRIIKREKTSLQEYNTMKMLYEKTHTKNNRVVIRRCVVWFNHSKPKRIIKTSDISDEAGATPLTEIEDEFNIRKDGLFDNDSHNKATYDSIEKYLVSLLSRHNLQSDEFSFSIT